MRNRELRIGIDALQVTPLGAGVARYIKELLAALREALSGSEVITAFVQRSALQVLPAPSEALTYRVLADGPTWRRIIRQQVNLPLARREFDVFHFPDYLTPVWWAKVPFVGTLHDMAYTVDRAFFTTGQRTLRRLANPLMIRRAAHLIADSHFTRLEALRCFPWLRESRVSVVYPGIPLLRAVGDEEQVACRYGLPHRFVLSVGTLEPRKNLQSLVKAFACPDLANESLVLVGREGWGPSVKTSFGADRQLQARIHSVGHIPDAHLAAIYRRASLFAYVSHYEGFGFPLLEALAAGLPAVASDIPALRETSHGAALFVDPNSPQSIARGIRELLDNKELRARLTRAAAEVARGYSWRSCAEGVLQVYRHASIERRGWL